MANTSVAIPFYDSNRSGEIISPTIINAYSALTIPAYWRAINFLADNLSSFPRAVHQGGIPADTTHPLNRILKRKPNAYQNPTAFWRTFFGHCANYGNGYAQIARTSGTNFVDSLHNLLPDDVWPFRYDHKDGAGPLQYYFVRSSKTILVNDDVLHISALSYDGMVGHNVVWMQRETLQRGITIDRYMTRFLQKGTVVRGAIEIPTSATPEQVEAFTALLRTQFRGAEAERDVLILSDGAKFNNTTMTPQDSQLIQQGAYTTKQIAQITGVPPQFLYEFGEQKYNGSSVEAMGQDVVRFTFRPWIEQTEDELTTKLLTDAEQDQGYEVKLDADALIRGDTTTVVNTTVAKVNAGLQSRNEGRRELGLPPSNDPEADKLRTLGDTTPQDNRPAADAPKTAGDAEPNGDGNGSFAKSHLHLSHFSALIADAADRVHTKTAKATDAAMKKHAGNTQAFTAWANVFTPEQAAFATTAIAPVFKTFANLSGKHVDGMAEKVGRHYGRELGQHLIALNHQTATTPPDLAAITLLLGGGNGPEPIPTPQI